MRVGYFVAVKQDGKELKCINVQKISGTSISLFPQDVSFFFPK